MRLRIIRNGNAPISRKLPEKSGFYDVTIRGWKLILRFNPVDKTWHHPQSRGGEECGRGNRFGFSRWAPNRLVSFKLATRRQLKVDGVLIKELKGLERLPKMV